MQCYASVVYAVIVSHQFITWTVDICAQYGKCEAPHHMDV